MQHSRDETLAQDGLKRNQGNTNTGHMTVHTYHVTKQNRLAQNAEYKTYGLQRKNYSQRSLNGSIVM